MTMKKTDVEISSIYAMKIGKNTIGVRIMSQNPDGHWIGTNINTGKELLIKSANQLFAYNPKPDKAAHGGAKTETPANSPKPKKERDTTQTSGLSAAAKVLEEAGEALNCQEMVKRMLEKGYWKTEGKTPAATIYSAIVRQIKVKGGDAQFRKTERGKFELAK
jgi:hypothetical protein